MWVIKHKVLGYFSGVACHGDEVWDDWSESEDKAYRFKIKPNLNDYISSAAGVSMMELIEVELVEK